MPQRALPVLPYRKPTRGRDYWVLDDVLPEADITAVRERCLAKDDWVKGYPYTAESWPGLRTSRSTRASSPGSSPGMVRSPGQLSAVYG